MKRILNLSLVVLEEPRLPRKNQSVEIDLRKEVNNPIAKIKNEIHEKDPERNVSKADLRATTGRKKNHFREN